MKIQRYLLAALAALTVTLQGCEEDVANFDLNATPMLVTTAFISPQDTALMVELSRTQPALGKHLKAEELRVPDATVTISDGSQEVRLVYDQTRDKYFSAKGELAVMAGKAYFLKVTTPAGEKAEASCTVPLLNGIHLTEFNFESATITSYGYPMVESKAFYKWQDAPGVENYYRATCYRTTSSMFGYPPTEYVQHEMLYSNDLDEYVMDAKQDGKILQSPEFKITTGDPDHATKPYKVYAILAVTDKAYYQYHLSVMNQSRDGGNPFAEPRLIYSNMKGSLGVFAAYNQIKVSRLVR